jgi:hypothetical protein
MISNFRSSAPNIVSDALLGPLVDLPGTWVGKGFNLISLPDKQGGKDFRIAMNATLDQITFSPIGAPFPDRGSVQDDIEFSGVHYLQRVSDAATVEDRRHDYNLDPPHSRLGRLTRQAHAACLQTPNFATSRCVGYRNRFHSPHGLSGLDRDESRQHVRR